MMKKKWVLCFYFIMVIIFVTSGLYAQSTNNGQRLVGTWIYDEDGSIWTFNSDGTLYAKSGSETMSGYWGVSVNNRIILITDGSSTLCEFFLSPDDRTLIFLFDENETLVFKKR